MVCIPPLNCQVNRAFHIHKYMNCGNTTGVEDHPRQPHASMRLNPPEGMGRIKSNLLGRTFPSRYRHRARGPNWQLAHSHSNVHVKWHNNQLPVGFVKKDRPIWFPILKKSFQRDISPK